MTKEDIQQRVLKNGKPLALDKFNWDEATNTFSSDCYNLITDLSGSSTNKIGNYSTNDIGNYSTNDIGGSSTNKIGNYSTNKIGSSSTNDIGGYSTNKIGNYSTNKIGSSSTNDIGGSSTILTYSNSKVVSTGDNSVLIIKNGDYNEVIKMEKGVEYHTAPYEVNGYLKNGIYSETGKKCIMADGILSEIISKKGNVYKVKNHNEENISYIVQDGEIYSHGKTIKEARESLMYKISNRDTSLYKDYKLDTILTKSEAIKCYRVITGACEAGARYFVEHINQSKDKFTIQEIIDITQGQYGNGEFREFFEKSNI